MFRVHEHNHINYRQVSAMLFWVFTKFPLASNLSQLSTKMQWVSVGNKLRSLGIVLDVI